jgi:drug/metabolite transporter (DMT)-like permease
MPHKLKSIILIVLCGLCWGPSFFFFKIALAELPALTVVLLRIGIGWVFMYGVCLALKQTDFDWKNQWRHYLVLGITMNVLPWYLICLGETYISTSLAGILNSLVLIITAILSHYFGPCDPFTKNKLLGVSLGVFGLGIIYLPMVFHERIESSLGVLLMILCCLCYAIGNVYAKSHLQKKISGNILLTGQLAVATLIMIPLSLFVDRPFTLPFPSMQVIWSAIWLGIIGTAVGFLIFYEAIKSAGATYASLSVLLIPLPAIFLGGVFLHEVLTWNIYLGTAVILAGVLSVNPIFERKI